MQYQPLKRCSQCNARSVDSVCAKCLPELKRKSREKREKTLAVYATTNDVDFYQSKLWHSLKENQLRLVPYCQGTKPDTLPCYATYKLTVDHIIPRSQGGPDRASNLQTLCQSCHLDKTNRENGVFPQQGQVIAVCGPPGSGKSHYVKEHWQYGDLLIDLDHITKAITLDNLVREPRYLLRMAWAMRDAALKQAEHRSSFSRLWILETAPSRIQRETYRTRYDARVIVIKPPQSTCIERCKADPMRKGMDWAPLIKQWFKQYRPSSIDELIE